MKKRHFTMLTIILLSVCFSPCKAEFVFEEAPDHGGRIYQMHEGEKTRILCLSLCSDSISKLYMLTADPVEDWLSIDSFDVETHQFSHISFVDLPPFYYTDIYAEPLSENDVNTIDTLFFRDSQELWGYDSAFGSFKQYDETSGEWNVRAHIDVDEYVNTYHWTSKRIYSSFTEPVAFNANVFYIMAVPVAENGWQFSLFRTDLETGYTERIDTGDTGHVLTIFPISDNRLGVTVQGQKLLVYSTETLEVLSSSIVRNEELEPLYHFSFFTCGDRLIAVDDERDRFISVIVNDDGEFAVQAVSDALGIHEHIDDCLINPSYFSYIYDWPEDGISYIDIVHFAFD